MPSAADIERILDQNPNWVMVSNKRNVVRGLEKLLADDERVIDLLDGLYRGKKISPDKDVAGVLFATDRRLLFVTSESSRPQYEEIPRGEIREIQYERAFSSIIMTVKMRSSNVAFRTFDNRAAVSKFIEAAAGDASGPSMREESTLRILNDINRTMKALSEMNRTIGLEHRTETASGKAEAALAVDPAVMDLLFRQAKRISGMITELLTEAGAEDLREAVTNDLIILSSLCSMADTTMSDEELFFISLILLPLNPDGKGDSALARDIFAHESFPTQRIGEVISFWDRISGYIRKTAPNLDLDGYSLRTMNLLERLDREKGTSLADKAAAALYEFAQCLMKADGSLAPDEEERLRLIYRLINRGATAAPVTAKEPEPEETLEQVMEKINALVGMEKIKEQIATLVNLIKVQKERQERNLPVTPLSLHSVFAGPPGTGKTTIARLLGRVYRCLGILKKGQLVETDRAGLVAGYVGQTAINVDSVVQKALDGVLFIDEAYALVPEDAGGRDFGQEAINIIIKRMEDYRDRLVVIVAGYTDEMERFILSNPGLKSRFSRYFYFDHYTPDELMKIFESFCANVKFKLEDAAAKKMHALLTSLHAKRDRTFGNGRLARNLFERVVERQANRLAGVTPLTDELLCTITEADIPEERDLTG